MLVSVAVIVGVAAGSIELATGAVAPQPAAVHPAASGLASGVAAAGLPGAVDPTATDPTADPRCVAAEPDSTPPVVYRLGHDILPAVTSLAGVDARLVCWFDADDSWNPVGDLVAGYATAAGPDAVAAYVGWLQYNAGFTAGPIDPAGGGGVQLWRNSVDAGAFLVVELSDDSAGVVIRVTRGGPDILPGAVWTSRLEGAGQPLPVGLGGLALTAGVTWARYAVQAPVGQCRRYADYGYGGGFGGTLLLTDQLPGVSPAGLTLADYAAAVVASADLTGRADLTGPVAAVIAGLPALTYRFEDFDTTFQYTVIDAPVDRYVVVADWWTDSGAGQVIQTMIDSIHLVF